MVQNRPSKLHFQLPTHPFSLAKGVMWFIPAGDLSPLGFCGRMASIRVGDSDISGPEGTSPEK